MLAAHAGINATRDILATGLGPLWRVPRGGGTPYPEPNKASHSGPKTSTLRDRSGGELLVFGNFWSYPQGKGQTN